MVQALAGNVEMHHSLKQKLSDVCGTRKRSGRDCSFESLAYGTLLRRISALKTERIIRKKREVILLRRKFLIMVHCLREVEMRW